MRRTMLRLFFVTIYMMLFALPVSAADSDFGQRAAGMAEITGARVSTQPDKTRIVLDASKPVAFKKMVLSNPGRVVVDIPDAWMSPKLKTEIGINSRFAGKVRIAQFDKKTVRVVVETTAGRENYKVFALKGGTVPGRVVMDFGNIGTDSPQAESSASGTAAEKPKTDSQPSTKPAEQTKADETANPDDESEDELDSITGLKGRRITIDPGHGGSDSGAIGPTGVMEKSVTLRVAQELKRLLAAEGAEVYMTRTTDTEVSPKGAKATDIEELQARCDIPNKNGSDIFISIHMDSFTSGAAKGTTGYYYSLGSKKSRELADKVRAGVIDQLDTQSRGTQSSNFYVVKHTDMPATLLEVAFISNPAEEQLMNSEEGIRKAAQGIADGIAAYFG